MHLCAQDAPQMLPIWKEVPPGDVLDMNLANPESIFQIGAENYVENVALPTITLFLATKEKNRGAGIVICPGGGYRMLDFEKEALPIAKRFQSIGVSAFVLKYRTAGNPKSDVDGYHYPVQLWDAQRAVRLVRSNAAEWGLNPSKIGVFGSSAGGHLASCVGTHFKGADEPTKDDIDRTNARPDFMILLYPVISTDEKIMERGSIKNFFGFTRPDRKIKATPEQMQLFSNELQVSPETPPTFLAHAEDDKIVKYQNSQVFFDALQKAGVPSEIHLFKTGGHGVGLGKEGTDIAGWFQACESWLRKNGLAE